MYSDLSETSHELAPDLEWMLQSNQVSNELLLETLVREHGVELYQLARSLLGDSRAAREVVAATILAVIEKRKRFWGKGSAKDWLFSLVIQTVFRRWLSFRTLRALRAVAPGRYRGVEEEAPLPESHWEAELWLCVDQLRRDQQAILSLKALNDLSETEIAQILNIPEPRVRLRLKQIWGKLEPILANLEINGEDFGSRVASSLRRRWRLEKFSDVDQEQLIKQVQRGQLNNTKRQRVQLAIRNLSLGLLVLFLVLAMSWVTNLLAEQKTPNPLVAPTVIVTRVVRVPVYVTSTPAPTIDAKPESLSLADDPAKVQARMAGSSRYWQNLWVDALIIEHGPSGYVGPPRIRRDQIWVSQPYHSLVLTGPLDGEVDHAWFTGDGRVYEVDIPSGRPTLYDFHPENRLPVYSALGRMIFPDEFAQYEGRVAVVGSGEVAGRDILRLELSDPGYLAAGTERPKSRAPSISPLG